MPRHEIFDQLCFCELGILRFENRFEVNRVQIAAFFCEVSALIENVGDATTHARGKISPTSSEHQDQALGHVFAAMVADSLDHRGRSGIANGEAFASDSIEKRFAAGGAVKGNVSNDDIFFGSEFRPSRRVHNQSSAGQSLAYVIVGLAFERK